MKQSMRLLICLICLAGLLVACSPAAPLASTPSVEPSATHTLRPTSTPKPAQPTRTPTATVPSPTPSITPVTEVALQTPIPQAAHPISAENTSLLQRVTVWGRGSIVDVLFTPDGSRFIVGSEFGVAVYDRLDPEQPSQWIAFPRRTQYQEMQISLDGATIFFKDEFKFSYLLLRSGEFLTEKPESAVFEDATEPIEVKTEFEWNEDSDQPLLTYTEQVYTRTVVDSTTGETLFNLTDEIPPVKYFDRAEPEGCDMDVFSPCGNALMAVLRVPVQYHVAPVGNTFAIQYGPQEFGDNTLYSTLRIYDAGTGAFLAGIGDFDYAVVDFAYSPVSDQILVGFRDGSIQLWDVAAQEIRFSARHFSSQIYSIMFTNDSQYLVIGRETRVEVRRMQDGLLLAQYDASAYDLSPDGRLIAVGTEDGLIKIREVANGQGLQTIEAHTDEIYSLRFSPDGRTLISSGQDCDIKAWDVETGEFLHFFEEAWANTGYFDPSRIFVYGTWFIPDTNQVIGYGSWGRLVSWDMNSGAQQYIIEPEELEYYNGMQTIDPHYPEYFEMDPEANLLTMEGKSYDLTTGEELGKPAEVNAAWDAPEGCDSSGAVTLDGARVFTAGYGDLDGKICILDAVDGHLVDTITAAPSAGQYAHSRYTPILTPDGARLLVVNDQGQVMVYEVVE